jgi:pimeloyl-ACP methyl ester carboxylesterase
MAFEDRVPRAPQPYRPGPDGPLEAEALRPLGPLPPPPAAAGATSLPSPPPFSGHRFPVHVRPARGPRRGTAILVPPWKLRSRRLLAGWERLLAREGLETWTVVPPHHLERTAPGARGGEAFVSADLGALRASLAQTVAEVRLAAAVAAARGGEVVLVGLSLGALAAAWAATGPERCDAVVLVAPPADLPAVFRDTPIGRRYGALAARAGAPLPAPGELARRLAPLAPLHRRPTAGRVLVAGGDHDLVAVGGARALSRAWGVAARAYPRGHLTLILGCRALRRDVVAFLRAPG